jgi:hypothetical protein
VTIGLGEISRSNHGSLVARRALADQAAMPAASTAATACSFWLLATGVVLLAG